MPTPQETFNQIVEAAKQKVQADAAAASAKQNSGADQITKTIAQIGETLPKLVQQNDVMAKRIELLEASRSGSTHQSDENDPYKNVEDYGLNRSNLQPVIRHETDALVEKKVNEVFEKSFGPAMREASAVREYQEKNPEFDLNKINSYLAKNPEVRTIVDNARTHGAFDVGIKYAETRMLMDDKIAAEARGQARADKRREHIEASRGDAAVLGGTGANGTSRTDTNPGLTPEKIEKAFAGANAGDWREFDKTFVHPNLPSEEWFQQLAQS